MEKVKESSSLERCRKGKRRRGDDVGGRKRGAKRPKDEGKSGQEEGKKVREVKEFNVKML